MDKNKTTDSLRVQSPEAPQAPQGGRKKDKKPFGERIVDWVDSYMPPRF